MDNNITTEEFDNSTDLLNVYDRNNVNTNMNNLTEGNEYYIKQIFNKGTGNEFINITKIIFKGYSNDKLLYNIPGYNHNGRLTKQSIDAIKEEKPGNPILKGGKRRIKKHKSKSIRRKRSKRKNIRRKTKKNI
jgi:hypothetical protein